MHDCTQQDTRPLPNKVILAGDFNIHVDDPSNKSAAEFLNTTESFNLAQHVTGPTHTHGHTLELVFTLGLNISSLLHMDAFYLTTAPSYSTL